jgi:hypothetical protein
VPHSYLRGAVFSSPARSDQVPQGRVLSRALRQQSRQPSHPRSYHHRIPLRHRFWRCHILPSCSTSWSSLWQLCCSTRRHCCCAAGV